MIEDATTVYKLIILYMLSRVDFPLTKTQINNFILEKEYTNFLTLQQVISELSEMNLIHAEPIRNRTHLAITEEGRNSLVFFANRLNSSLKKDIDSYLRDNKLELRDEVSVLSNYRKASSGDYEAHLIAKDKGLTLVDLKLTVPVEDMAITICENWTKKNQEVYKYLTEQLF